MRILSQDGLHEGIIDVPYEQVSIEQKGNEIWCGYSSAMDRHCVGKCFAKYSTEAKARKAMQMLHNAYTGLIFAQNTELPEDGVERLREMTKNGFGILYAVEGAESVRFEPLNICFQFPADDEVEV